MSKNKNVLLLRRIKQKFGSQVRLAEETGLNRMTIKNAIDGKNLEDNTKLLIANAVGAPVEELFPNERRAVNGY